MADDPWAVVSTTPVESKAADPWAVVKSEPATSVAETPHTTAPGLAASAGRGMAPYAAGAALGAAAGAPLGGIGAVPGAALGAGAVGLTQLSLSIYNPIAKKLGLPQAMTPQEATDKLLDLAGIKRPETGTERVTEATAGGAASALTGAGAAGELAGSLTGTSGAVAGRLAEQPVRQAVSGALGGTTAQTAAEAGIGPVGQAVAGLVGSAGPYARNPLSPSHINASQAAKDAINAGFAIPPAEASEGHIGEMNLTNVAAGEAGKIKLGQLASAKNQPMVNVYAQQDLGLPPGTVLTPKAFEDVRAREGQTYDEVSKAVPEVDLSRDREFVNAARQVGSPSAETEALFPSTKEPPGVKELRDEMIAHSRASTPAVMKYIADLRFNATQNFQKLGDAMAHRMGAAQRQAAGVLEDALERSVKNAPDYYAEKFNGALTEQRDAAQKITDANTALTKARAILATNSNIYTSADAMRAERVAQKALDAAHAQFDAATGRVEDWRGRLQGAHAKNADNQTLLDRFRKARQTMAKSYDVQAVTNVSTGDVSATGLGRLLQQGKPLTGNLKLIADSANNFRRAFQNPAAFGGVEPLSVIDAATAAMLASQGHVVPAAGILGRPWLRGRVLSPGYQQGMISDRPSRFVPLPILTNPGASSVVPLPNMQPLYPSSPAAPMIQDQQ